MRKGRSALLAITALAIVAAVALTAAQAAPAGTVTVPGWRVVSATNYLPSAIFGSGYGTVVAPAADDAWAFGGTEDDSPIGTPVAVHWNGTSWSVARRWAQTDGNAPDFSGITAFSATDVWVFGGEVSGLTQLVGFGTWHYNGRTWTQIGGQGRNIVQASAVSPADMWAIGGYYPSTDQVDHYNGKSWTRVPVTAPPHSQLNMIAGDGQGRINVADCSLSGPTRCWVLHRSPSGTWTRTTLAAGTVMYTMVHIPGTRSSWGAGTGYGPDPSDATIWADGTLPETGSAPGF